MKLAALIVGLLIAAAIAWNAGERHYDNCVRDARTSQSEFDRFTEEIKGKPAHGCSRWPF